METYNYAQLLLRDDRGGAAFGCVPARRKTSMKQSVKKIRNRRRPFERGPLDGWAEDALGALAVFGCLLFTFGWLAL